jgi:tetratricopeptide (TPR) repeat protein
MRIRARSLPGCLLLALLWSLPARAQDWRGQGRLTGWVKDPNGQGIADATLALSREKGGGTSTKTNKKGYWAIVGLSEGRWNIDVSAPGYETRKVSVTVSEGGRVPPMDIQLQKAVAAAAPAATEADAGAKAGAEAVAAVTEGNKLLGEKKFAEARAQYEKAAALLPPNAGLWKGIAQTYHGEKNDPKTIEALRKAAELDPNDTDSRLLLATLLIEQGQHEEGKTLLDALPPGSVKDPAVYVNLGIVFMNKKKPEDASAYLTKAIELDPAQPESYYYRGLSHIQSKKNAEAKADFRKYLELAPDGAEAKEVKEMLQALK